MVLSQNRVGNDRLRHYWNITNYKFNQKPRSKDPDFLLGAFNEGIYTGRILGTGRFMKTVRQFELPTEQCVSKSVFLIFRQLDIHQEE